MLKALRRSVALPRASSQVVWTAATVLAFGWLLANDRVHAVAIYLLELYLTF